jgi:hypothetical protein
MTMFAQPLGGTGEEPAPDELVALSRLESTCNTIRIRIAGLAPDQLYRGATGQLSIAEELALAVDRERAYLQAFRRTLDESDAHLVEPQPGPPFLDRDFGDDIAEFFDLRRGTLDLLRTLDAEWDRTVTLPGDKRATLRDLAIRLAQLDARMLRGISEQRRVFLRTTGVDELRDPGVAGKLGPNIGQ